MAVDRGSSYPVNLVLLGTRCLVVGGGPVAVRKARGLLDAGAEVHVVTLEVVDPELRDLDVTIEERAYRSEDADGGYRLIMAATDNLDTNQRVYSDARSRGIFVNSADDPDRCTFTLPAILRRGPLAIAVSTGGGSPALAAWVRDRLAGEIGPEYETLVGILSEERQSILASGRSTEGLDWQGALESGMLELIREGRLAEAKERLQACLSSSSG